MPPSGSCSRRALKNDTALPIEMSRFQPKKTARIRLAGTSVSEPGPIFSLSEPIPEALVPVAARPCCSVARSSGSSARSSASPARLHPNAARASGGPARSRGSLWRLSRAFTDQNRAKTGHSEVADGRPAVVGNREKDHFDVKKGGFCSQDVPRVRAEVPLGRAEVPRARAETGSRRAEVPRGRAELGTNLRNICDCCPRTTWARRRIRGGSEKAPA